MLNQKIAHGPVSSRKLQYPQRNIIWNNEPSIPKKRPRSLLPFLTILISSDIDSWSVIISFHDIICRTNIKNYVLGVTTGWVTNIPYPAGKNKTGLLAKGTTWECTGIRILYWILPVHNFITERDHWKRKWVDSYLSYFHFCLTNLNRQLVFDAKLSNKPFSYLT